MTPDAPTQIEGLSDQQLLERESRDRCNFLRLDQVEPRSSGTTFRAIRASRALLEAWNRWTQSGAAARMRGLNPRAPGADE